MDELCEDSEPHDWEAIGYGDRRCGKCGATDYAESEEDFFARIYGAKANASTESHLVKNG